MCASKILLCEICQKGNAIYSCPRCDKKYCSSVCYKNREHELCSESFYREWVESSLNDRAMDATEKNKMIQILKRFHNSATEDAESSVALLDRFADLNLDDLDEDTLWQNLNEKEREEFKSLIEDNKNLESIIPVKQPWWTVTMINLVTEMNDEIPEKADDISLRPLYPLNVKKLSSITNKKPSECIQFNLVNILYAYAFLNRFYNCDMRDFLEDVIQSLYQFSPVLSEGKNYSSLEESVQDTIRLIINSDLGVPLDFVKSIVNDVSGILQGPKNTRPSHFVLCALNDVELLCFELKAIEKKKANPDKTFKTKLSTTIKKIDYYMSWSLDFESGFSELASELVLLMLPDLFTDPVTSKPEESTKEIVKKKPLIEEVE